ncbi:MFS transporter [Prauserella flavalba]|uniref:Multidrug MFS transporter n=1 Tax=Prauserella flavalba TaxID=1477506 RepID=A0A318LJT2_9PSEU|nr:MFS transporter [Prauserella flavalba]PXY26366.1 multidrug MFS transporter [Prauserella flavalba]
MTAPDPRRWWALGALVFAVLAFGLDVTVLNVALPTLAVDLHATTSELQWFANSYTLVLAAGLLPAGLLGDRFGPKRLLVAGLVVFGVASVACAYAGTPELLIAARALLGVGGALLVPLSMSVLTVLFPGEERARAIGVWSAAIALGIPLGPVVGGWLLDNFWWGSVFLVNVPFVVVGVVAVAFLVPNLPGRPGQGIDVVGIALSSAGLVALTYGLTEAGERGWGAAVALVPLLGGGVLLVAFALWLRRAAHPLVDRALFRSRGFTWGAVLATLASFALMGAMFVLPQLFQAVNGAGALGTGLRLLPIVGGLLAGVQVAERLRNRFGAKVVVATGFAIMAVGGVLGTTTGATDGYGFIAAWITVLGLGLGFALPPAMDIAMGSLDTERSGVGSGLLQAMRQVGGTLGVAVLGTVLNAGYTSAVDVTGLPPAAADAVRDSAAAGVQAARDLPGLLGSVHEAFVTGMTATLWVSVAFAVAGVALTLRFLPRRPEDVVRAESGHDYVAS